MIRDVILRWLFIPFLGILIPLLSGFITYNRYSLAALAGVQLFFILVSFGIWVGCNWIHIKLRSYYNYKTNPFIKIVSISLVSSLYSAGFGGLLSFIWFQFSGEIFEWDHFYKFITLCTIAVILFTLVYEILYLSKERELDYRVVDQLDYERSQAEMALLKNELDPHFIFNSLNSLSQLILNSKEKAHLFNNKLACVYKYFLINKERDLIPLEDELNFINNYFYLLQIRHENKISLIIDIDNSYKLPLFVLTCALQTPIENAIKHNEYSDEKPLEIFVRLTDDHICITNNIRPKPYLPGSTGIGLKNLSTRYRFICNREVVVERNTENFTVRIPIIHNKPDYSFPYQNKSYVKTNHN